MYDSQDKVIKSKYRQYVVGLGVEWNDLRELKEKRSSIMQTEKKNVGEIARELSALWSGDAENKLNRRG